MSYSRRDFLKTGTALTLVNILPAPLWAQEQSGSDTDGVMNRGGTVWVQMNDEQRTLNSALRASTGVYIVSAKIMEALVGLKFDGGPEPMLATSWEASLDGLTHTFKLRKGVKWHDGKPFTSADVQYTALEMWKKYLNYGTTLQMYLQSVDTPDEHTAVFNYSRPMPSGLLLRALADLGYIAPKHIYEGTDVLRNPANLAPIGTGPFKFKEYKRGQYIIATRNPDYWRPDDMPYLDSLVWRLIPDPAAAVAPVKKGEIQVSPENQLPMANLKQLQNNADYLEVSSRGESAISYFNTIEFNFRRKELADHRVREAIVRAMNIPFFIESFTYGFGKLATGPIPSTDKDFYVDDAPTYPYDIQLAEALLEEAGYPRDATGKRFKLRLLPAPWAEDVRLWSIFMAQSLNRIGIEVEIKRYDAAGYLAKVYKQWDFDLSTGWHVYRGDPAVSTSVWYRSGSLRGTPWSNQWGWKSEEIDQLLDAAAFQVDYEKRVALYEEFVRKVNKIIPLWMAIERQFITVTNESLVNERNNPRWPSSHWSDLWRKG